MIATFKKLQTFYEIIAEKRTPSIVGLLVSTLFFFSYELRRIAWFFVIMVAFFVSFMKALQKNE